MTVMHTSKNRRILGCKDLEFAQARIGRSLDPQIRRFSNPWCQVLMSDFVHLHLHTEYSLLDGACRIDELLDQAVKLKMPAIAVTEHGNLFSSVIFHDHARARGLNPILGCEVYVAPGSRFDKSGPQT